MPATFTLLKATPYSASYIVDGGDGSEGILDYSGPAFLDLVSGPLRTTVRRRLGSLGSLDLTSGTGSPVSIYFPTGVNQTYSTSFNHLIHWVANGLSVTLSDSAGGEFTTKTIIEIRFRHSRERH